MGSNVDNNLNCYGNENDGNIGMNFQFMFSSFVDRKLTIYFFIWLLQVFSQFLYFLKCDLNWIIKWTNLNTMNSIVQISEYSCFFNDDDNNFMLVISLKPTKKINLYRFKILIFYRKLALHKNSTQIYYFD